jgi:membrane fusion protein, multidrug efflux system
MPSIKSGMEVEVHLLSYPGRPFRGVVQGIGWVNHPDDRATVGVLPEVRKTLNWVRLANRFPVRIFLEERDAERPFRMGTAAVVPTRGFSAQAAPGAPAR